MEATICARNEENVHRLFKALSGKSPDFAAAEALFAEDSHYWALTPVSPQIHGAKAIIEDVKRQLEMGGDLESGTPYAVVSSNNHVVLERTDYVTVALNQKRAGVRICSIFEFDDAGKITEWREYWDKSYCMEQMGFAGSAY